MSKFEQGDRVAFKGDAGESLVGTVNIVRNEFYELVIETDDHREWEVPMDECKPNKLMDIYVKLLEIASKNVALSKEERETLKAAANMITDFAVLDALRDLKKKYSNEYRCACEPGPTDACICYLHKEVK